MANASIKHPLLSNPVKWLKHNKYHSADFYETSFYNTKSISSNPFAQILSETRMDGTRIRFPKGQMLQLVVDSYPEPVLSLAPSKDKNYFLTPLINKPEPNSVLFPSHYILKSHTYINYIIKSNQWRRFIPQKFKFKNDKVLGSRVNVLPNIETIIPAIYEENITRLLPESNAKEMTTEPPTDMGLILNFEKEGETLITFKDSTPIINLSKFPFTKTKESYKGKLFITYRENPELCFNIVSLIGYHS